MTQEKGKKQQGRPATGTSFVARSFNVRPEHIEWFEDMRLKKGMSANSLVREALDQLKERMNTANS